MEEGNNQPAPNGGAPDIIHNPVVARGDKYTSFNFQFTLCQLSPALVGVPDPRIARPACVDQPGARTGAPRARGQCCPHYSCGGIQQYFDVDRGPLPQTFPELIN